MNSLGEMCCLTILLITVCSFAINMHLNYKCNADNKTTFNKIENGLFIGALVIAVIIFALMILGLVSGEEEIAIAANPWNNCRLCFMIIVVIVVCSLAINMQNNLKCINNSVEENKTSNTEFLIFIIGLIISVISLMFVMYKMFHHEDYKYLHL